MIVSDLISRKAAMDLFMGKPPDYYHSSYIVGEINCLPSVETEPVKQGVWYCGPDNMWTCSECEQTWEVGDGWRWRFNYCPHCGAKNVEEKL